MGIGLNANNHRGFPVVGIAGATNAVKRFFRNCRDARHGLNRLHIRREKERTHV
jgi:hypothetical protein